MTRKINNFICVMLAVCVQIVWTIQEERCEQSTYLSPSGLTCFYCIPGTYKVEDCKTNYTGALCTKCPKNTYQRNCNRAESCELCSLQCKARSQKVQNCTLYENIICKCREGHYFFQEPSTDGVCLQHKPCEVGYGMVNPGNPYNDTECKECDNGTFSNSTTFDRCRLCRECDNYKTLCTTKKDAECQDVSDRPTQTTERYNSSTVHSSTAHLPKQTTECSDGFKGQFAILVVLNSLILLICVFICVLIYVSGKCTRVQELSKCSCCPNCRNRPANPGVNASPPNTNSESGRLSGVNASPPNTNSGVNASPPNTNSESDRLSQEEGISPQERSSTIIIMPQEESMSPQESCSTCMNMSNPSTPYTDDNHDESDTEPSSTTPLMSNQQAEQSFCSNTTNSGQGANKIVPPRENTQKSTKSDEGFDSRDNSNGLVVTKSSENSSSQQIQSFQNKSRFQNIQEGKKSSS